MVARAEDDYTVRIELPGLSPATRYWYRAAARRAAGALPPRALRRAHRARGRSAVPHRVRLLCARADRSGAADLRRQSRQVEPDLFVWLGDNIYGDSDRPELLAEEYRRQRNVAALEPLLASVPQIATWDDHDFGLNNADRTYSGARGFAPRVSQLLGQSRERPAPTTPASSSSTSTRRRPLRARRPLPPRRRTQAPDGPGKTMLGRGSELAWLDAGLRASRAPFKVLVSGSGWSMADGPQGDTWAAFRHERDRAVRLHPRPAHRRRRAALRRHTHRRAQLHPLVRARRLRPLRPRELAARPGDEHQLRDARRPSIGCAPGVFGRGQFRRARFRVGARAAAAFHAAQRCAASLSGSRLRSRQASCERPRDLRREDDPA